MKKIDTFYMSDKQIEQLKKIRKPNKKMAKAAVFMLVSIACFILGTFSSEILQNFGLQQSTLEAVEKIILGTSGLGILSGLISLFKSDFEPLDMDYKSRIDLEKMGEIEDYERYKKR